MSPCAFPRSRLSASLLSVGRRLLPPGGPSERHQREKGPRETPVGVPMGVRRGGGRGIEALSKTGWIGFTGTGRAEPGVARCEAP